MMNEMVIHPYESFGPVALNAVADDIIEELGPPDADFPPTTTAGRRLTYRELGLHVSLDVADRCDAIESTLRYVPVINDLQLVGGLDDLIAALEQRGFRIGRGPDPWSPEITYCEQLGITLWREDDDQPNIDSVTALRRGKLDEIIPSELRLGLHPE